MFLLYIAALLVVMAGGASLTSFAPPESFLPRVQIARSPDWENEGVIAVNAFFEGRPPTWKISDTAHASFVFRFKTARDGFSLRLCPDPYPGNVTYCFEVDIKS